MSETVTAQSAGVASTWVYVGGERREVTALTGLFDLLVLDAMRFRLVPRSDLARSLLAMWMCSGLPISLNPAPIEPRTAFQEP